MTDAAELSTPATGSAPARVTLPDGQAIDLPVTVGSEGERGIDIAKLRGETGYITLDPAYGNTGSCESAITYIDGEKGILRYRGYPIEQLAENSSFIEVAWLLIFGKLPGEDELLEFRQLLTDNEMLHEGLRNAFEGFPPYAHPMAILSAMINASACYNPDVMEIENEDQVPMAAAKLISKVRTLAAFSYKKSIGQPARYPNPDLSYCENFLHMMFSIPYARYHAEPEVLRALSLFLILHADHEQNCSTSTVRMVGSSGASLSASVASGVCALWGPLHGGANQAVIEMLTEIQRTGMPVTEVVEKVKQREMKLMGFGHRVYKNFDPRARILEKAAADVLKKLGIADRKLDIAKELEEVALTDSYFVDRKLYPNVDFYSGIILNALGIPTNMFTVMFAIGRMPGWIAHWFEAYKQAGRICRPRQIYTGETERDYVPINQR